MAPILICYAPKRLAASVVKVAAVILVFLLLAVLLHLSPLDRRSVVPDGATHGSPHNGMVCEMSSNAPDHGALKATCGL